LKQDIFIKIETFFNIKRDENESQSVLRRRVKDTARCAYLHDMTVQDPAMHSYLFNCGSKVLEYVKLQSRNIQTNLDQVKEAIKNREYLQHMNQSERTGRPREKVNRIKIGTEKGKKNKLRSKTRSKSTNRRKSP
jgi:hypothetical protein